MNEERARQGVEHLQAAAVEVIAAMRAFLDVAEDVVRDPSAVVAMATSVAESAARAGAASSPADGRGGADPSDPPADGRVTRIRVS